MTTRDLAAVRELGESVEKSWAALDFAPDAFTKICSAALHETEVFGRVSGSALLAQVADDARLPEERFRENKVVDEQLTLFRCPHFVIQLLVWIDGITDIHDHQLSGAYLALEGERVESAYRFVAEQWLEEDAVRVGRLMFVGMDRVQVGAVRPFIPGSRDLHAVFHLHHPSLTLAIRSPRPDADGGFNYWRPGLGVRTRIRARVRQRIQALGAMRAAGYAEYPRALESALLRAEPLELCWLFNAHRDAYAGRPAELRSVLSRLQDRHGPWIVAFARAFAERTRMSLVRSLRQMERDVDCRIALALVLHGHSRDDLPGARSPRVEAALASLADRVPALRADVERLLGT